MGSWDETGESSWEQELDTQPGGSVGDHLFFIKPCWLSEVSQVPGIQTYHVTGNTLHFFAFSASKTQIVVVCQVTVGATFFKSLSKVFWWATKVFLSSKPKDLVHRLAGSVVTGFNVK